MRLKFGLFLVILTLGIRAAQSQLPYQPVIEKYKSFLIAQDTTSTDSIKLWTSTLQADGAWADLNYKDQNSSSWKTTEHLNRLVKISIAYHKTTSAFYKNKQMWEVIVNATNHWLSKNYKNSNWWYNEIGVPQFWRDILTLNADFFAGNERKKALEILAHYNLKPNFTGANLTWSADLAMHYGLFTKNDSLINKASKLIANEIKLSNGEGIRPDYSYHQHG
ncbi:MAG: chondroitin AC lyase, partial [Pedobacter sp.]